MLAQFEIKELETLFSFNSNIKNKNTKFSICTDSRNIKENQIFLPLIGEKFDGHDFINSVSWAFCERDKIYKVKEEHRSNLILVKNTLDTYHLLANYYRNKVNPKVIAITGSSGKTTVKELISEVLSTKFRVHKTEANFNNEIGVPKTILEMSLGTEVLVLELAMRKEGEIKYLAKTTEPDIALITNIGTAHIGRLGSIKSILKAKCEILEYLKRDGLAVLFNDSRLVQFVHEVWRWKTATFDLSQAKNISYENGKTYFELDVKSAASEKYYVNALGKTHVLNSLSAILIGKYLSLLPSEIQEGLASFELPKSRGNVIELPEDIYIIDESYNANPDSLKTAVENMTECWNSEFKKVLVLGELAELGAFEDPLIDDLAKWLLQRPISCVITIGERLKEIKFATNVKDINGCCDILKGLLEPKTVVLVKGSHIAGLEKVVECFQKTRVFSKQ
ncbi:MAG: UDP-N-acetylmuramoyl-tripeptide--D-alanyl-D-alanine ligase [Candidatus Melainabacteria bacterium]|nr:UDP-N-acetylmuramoyl-tripeptide--D-alanyl-D-alanine ligase [Candidatus Melainabacteria bacterium]